VKGTPLILAMCLTAVIAPAAVASGSDSLYVPDIEVFMQIGYADQPSISPDGKVTFFTASLSGVNQLYREDESGWPYQLTTFEDGIDFYVLSPSASHAVVGASVGGNEQSQLYLMDARTGELLKLTNLPEVRFGAPVWSPDERTIYFGSNEANGRDFYIYKMDLDKRERELILELKGWNGPADISRDGHLLLVYQYTANVNNNLYLLDLPTGKSDLVTPHEGNVLFEGAQFTPDAQKIYLTCDGNDEGLARLATLDVKTKKLTYLPDETEWEVDAMVISRDGAYLAWIVNENGYGNLRIKDLKNDRCLPAPDLAGIVSEPYFSEVGSLVFSFTSPTNTYDIWKWDLKSRELTQMTHSTYAGIDPSLFSAPKLIHYPSFDGLKIPAFLFTPPGWSGGPIPFVVHAHGGPEAQFRPSFARHFQYLMLNGYGILAPNVRGSAGYGKSYMAMDDYKKRTDSVDDLAAGAKWLIEKGYTKPEMLAVKGASYGGFMTLASLTRHPDLFAAGIDVVGIANFVSFLENTKAYRRALREAEYGPLSDREFLKEISPLTHVDRIRAPLLVIHGENDPRVPVGEARQIAEALRARGGHVETIIFPDEGHGVGKLSNRLVMYRAMVDFLDKTIKKHAAK